MIIVNGEPKEVKSLQKLCKNLKKSVTLYLSHSIWMQ